MLSATIAKTTSVTTAPSAQRQNRTNLPNRDLLDPDGALRSFIVVPRLEQGNRRSGARIGVAFQPSCAVIFRYASCGVEISAVRGVNSFTHATSCKIARFQI